MSNTTSRGDAGSGIGPGLRLVAAAADAYAHIFARSQVAPLLSHPKPVRHNGFDTNLMVERVVREAADVVSISFVDPDGGQLSAWSPGSHLDVFLPSGKQRQYSLSGDPTDLGRYRITVRLIHDGGGGSREVHETIRSGDLVHVRGPRNAFRLVESDSYLFIAGGIGITPILPMVKAIDAAGLPWQLVYLGRTRASMPFQAELAQCTGGTVDIRPDDEFGIPDVAQLLSRVVPGGSVYVCGPSPVLQAAKEAMPRIDPTSSLHTERFSARPVEGGEPFDLELVRSGVRVSVGADESALAAIRRKLPGVAYSCQQGFCGTCKIGVLTGDVDHRDTILLDSERQTSMLTCVSRSAGGPLALDL